MSLLFEIENLRCSYDKDSTNKSPKIVLDIRRLAIPRGKKVFIVGESGIGKSTILETLGMMNNTMVVSPETKALFYDGDANSVDMAQLWSQDDEALSYFRLKHFSFIFQSTNLMRNFSAYENIALTRMLQGYSQQESFERAREVLRDLGLEHINQDRMTQELSGGQQQRLAFARAILPDFTVLFGDEPTGNLDGDNAVKVMTILSDKLVKKPESSAIIVSHDMDEIAENCTKAAIFSEGKILGVAEPKDLFKRVKEIQEIGLDVPLTAKIVDSIKKHGIEIDCDYTEKDFIRQTLLYEKGRGTCPVEGGERHA